MARLLALVVDRDASLRADLQDRLGALGVETLGAVSHAEAQARALERPVDLVFSAPGDWIAACATWPRRPVRVALFADAEALLESGASWLGRGADDLLALDSDRRAATLALTRCLAWSEQLGRAAELRTEAREREGFGSLVGRSAALESIRERLQRLAPIDQNLWIEGEPGVGKLWCARTLHRLAAGAEDPFVAVEAADLDTSGWEQRWLPASDDGVGPGLTLYLVEPAGFSAQAVERLRSSMLLLEASTDRRRVRVISGSTTPLAQLAADGTLPPALVRTLSQAWLTIPPLRERIEDVGPLAQHFIRSIEQVNQLDPLRLSPEALDRLEEHAWPGNVRELRHAIEHAAILADGLIELAHLPRSLREAAATNAALRGDPAARAFREAKGEVVAQFEAAYLMSLMKRERGNVTSAAREAGMLRSALQRLLRKYGLRSVDFRRGSSAASGPSTRAPRTV